MSDGIYVFGGVNSKGEMSNELRYLKPHVSEGRVMSAEWVKLKMQGAPPQGRIGHTMSYLKINQALLIVGGRNDELCKNTNSPFLDDISLFLLDQKTWVKIRYTPFSNFSPKIGNHCMTTLTDGETYEKTIIFGGITKHPMKSRCTHQRSGSAMRGQFDDQGKAALSNEVYILEIRQIL